ncbi:hypothetical protein [uncultured Roseobacter sp.]|uniref:hypothetical protein n=1 Tax=uncultured Roseobacter sp. TaxID=114847 RepID=UPI002629FE45|nr:hypothetical protein [uncultured Roseobacter sp.]
MLRLFNTLNTAKHDRIVATSAEKFSRFEPRHVRETLSEDVVIPAQSARQTPAPVAAYRPASLAAKRAEPKFDDAAHLHSEARVSVAVLRRALPIRFAEIA